MNNDVHVVKLERMTYGGETMGKLPDNRAVFVPFGLPGEKVTIRLLENKRNFARGEILEVIEPSEHRITPSCSHFGRCGGCHYQHISYDYQTRIKTEILQEQLRRIGGLENAPISAMLSGPKPWNYRNHMQFQVCADGRLGFRGFNGKEIIPISECHLPEEELNSAWPLLEFEPACGVERADFRLGLDEEVMLLLESRHASPPNLDLEAGISVIHQFRGDNLVMAGDDHLFFAVKVQPRNGEIKKKVFRVSAGSFFQVNNSMTTKLVECLLDLLPDQIGTVLDIFCGVGLFSAFLAERSRKIIGIEVSAAACEDYAFNLDEFNHIELYEAPAEQALAQLKANADVILVDPPRAGLTRRTLQAILEKAPEIIAYISCNPTTLGRDARQLVAGGYLLEQVIPVDMFPQTYHIESVSRFRKVK